MQYIYTPESYYVLAKMEYLNPYFQFSQGERKEEIALGGLYEIDYEETEDKIHIKPGNFIVKKCELIPYEDKKYNFSIGDEVVIKPLCNERDYFEIGGYFKIGKSYKVKRIINSFYLTLVNENGFEGNPIRFCDVQKVL